MTRGATTPDHRRPSQPLFMLENLEGFANGIELVRIKKYSVFFERCTIPHVNTEDEFWR